MILSAGLTPAWQQILVFTEFREGQVNRAAQALWCASGKVLNAGIAAHHLGGPSLTLSTLGGVAGEQIDAEFDTLGVPHRWVPTRCATRVCTTILDATQGTITELVENGRPLQADELQQFAAAYVEHVARAAVVVLIGSLPQDTPHSFYRQLLEHTACPVVLDFRGPGLLAVLDLQPEVIKPNREELAATVGRPLDDEPSLLAAMRSLNDRGARWVVVTHGPQAVLVSSAQIAYRLTPRPLPQIVNPIGCGDALAATIAWALRDGQSPVDAVRLGLAAAAQNACQLLPCRIDPRTLPASADAITVDEIG